MQCSFDQIKGALHRLIVGSKLKEQMTANNLLEAVAEGFESGVEHIAELLHMKKS